MFTRDVMCTGKVVETQVVEHSAVHEVRTADKGDYNDVIGFIMTVLGAVF